MVLIVLPDSGRRRTSAPHAGSPRPKRPNRHEECAALTYRLQKASTAFIRRRLSVVT